MNWKLRYGKDAISFTLNILRFPSFQSPLVLPNAQRTVYRQRLVTWLAHWADSEFIQEHEINHTQRLIDYLDVVETPHTEAFEMPKLLNDFKHFIHSMINAGAKTLPLHFPN
jgi:hypothetical protein